MYKILNVLLVDDHPVVLDGLKSLLKNVKYLEVKNIASNGKDALSILKNEETDILISDISMPDMDGIELTETVKKIYPNIKVLLLTAYNEKEILKRALYSGAEACLLKNSSKKEILNAVNKITDNGYYYCDDILEIARYINKDVETETEITISLSTRELEVLELILLGNSNKDIADALYISYHTVGTHRKNIMKKTGSNNISGLFNYTKKHNLFPSLFS